ncbi:hypothetical protein AB0D07_37370, partial [Streptomyces globisporus]
PPAPRARRPAAAPRAGRAPKHGFWIFDESRVVVETINTELSFDTADDLDMYGTTWDGLNESAAYGARAHRIIARARHLIAPS